MKACKNNMLRQTYPVSETTLLH